MNPRTPYSSDKTSRATRHAARSHAAHPTVLKTTGRVILAVFFQHVRKRLHVVPANARLDQIARFVARASGIVDEYIARENRRCRDFRCIRRERTDADHEPPGLRRERVDGRLAGGGRDDDVNRIRDIGVAKGARSPTAPGAPRKTLRRARAASRESGCAPPDRGSPAPRRGAAPACPCR